MMLVNVLIDWEGQVIAKRSFLCNPLSYLAGGDLQKWGIHIMHLGTDPG
jgi:hypothetical protein